MAPDGNMLTTRFHLRDATSMDHAAAEAVHYAHQKFADKNAYFDYLTSLYAAHLTLGLPAAQLRQDVGEEAYHQTHVGLICEDLGHTPRPESACDPVRSLGEAWGISYALIGSALGATAVLRDLGSSSDWPTAYLDASARFAKSRGVATFFAALNAANPDPDEATFGARRVFARIAGQVTPEKDLTQVK